ncbi:T9SS type A sorting domain-containing protein [Hymenobacter sp. DH14]|uniref:T9SS type A sorting domain-containing protein n=1 Tax=Hymenobacter cyanobacteriorum TaxID=2926463 RepID=A0A9X1VJG3_9BACT|nr:T9SS type A sorting domain-containing protein [Hymenobacter cyanobacteriorum]MCI1188150.1 T9SS type A sorting domain-containing protein [Hymenobacter cyanobacteriorum]
MHTFLLSSRLGRWLAVAVLALLAAPGAQAQLSGAKAIPGDYATVAAAITALNAGGVGAGGVTFNIAAGYTETFASPTAGAITATGTAANPIVFQKSGSGANPKITAGVGTTTNLDAIISLSGSDYVTLDGLELAENAANTTATTQMEFGIALFRPSATDGCQFNVVRNCVITLNKANTGTFGIYGAASTAASATSVAATAPSGANSSNKVSGNIITNSASGMYFTASTSTTLANYDQSNEVGVTAANQVYNFGTTATGWGIGGNYQNGFRVLNNVVNNTLNYVGGTTVPVAASTVTSTLRGIYGNTAPSASIDITGNTITLASGATTSTTTGIDNGIGSTAASNTVNITNNTVTISSATVTTGAVVGITSSASAATVNVTGNTVSNCSLSGATTAVFTAISNSASAGTITLSNNTVSNNTATGTGTMSLISGGSPTALTMNSNTLTGNSKPPAAPSASITLQCLVSSTTAVTANNNTVSNNTIVISGTSTSAGTVYGYSNGGSPTAETLTSNSFSGLSVSGTSTATTHLVVGIRTNTSTSDVQTITQNTINGLAIAGSGSGTVNGFSFLLGGGTGTLISRNKVYDLSAVGAGATVNGISISGGGTYLVANNLLGDLRTPAATGLTAVSGVAVSGGTAANLYYNTLYLNASSSATPFGTSGIYLATTATTADLRNNIVVNKSTAAGTGLTVALRRSAAALTGYASTSNNNLYYAGTPSATQVLYYDGTTAYQTLGALQGAVAPRESSSVTEDAPFLSTTGSAATFLHINPAVATQVESGAAPLASVTTDFDGDARNATTPDIGADEGTFTPQDLSGPAIAFTPLGSTASTASRTLAVTITDPSGVATGANAPRLYFRKGTTGAFAFVNPNSVSGSTYTFTFDYSLIGGAAGFDVIQYYVAAQDALGNASTNPGGGSGANPPGTTPPTSVYQYLIQGALAGTYYVGTSTSPNPARTYPTLTAAVNAYNANTLGGAVTFLLLDAAYSASTGETFPIAIFNQADASATNTLTISPNTGVSATVTAAGSVLVLASSRYVTIDGSNTTGGTTRNLTLTNSTLTASTYGVGLLLQSGQTQGNQFATIRNVNVVGGGLTTNATLGIVLAGADNDNVTLQNNSVVGVTTGIQAAGTALASAGGLDNLALTGNVVGPTTATTGANINGTGILLSNVIAPSVTGNTVQNVISTGTALGLQVQNATTPTVTGNSVLNVVTSAGAATGLALFASTGGTLSQNLLQGLTGNSSTGLSVGLLLGSGTTGVVIDRNRLQGLTEVNTGGNGVKGIEVQTAQTAANVRISNNFVQVPGATGFSGTTYSNAGIRLSGTQSGINLYYNSVNLTGTDTYNIASISAGLVVLTGSTALDIRNNIFRNSIVNSGNAGAKAYAFYSTAPAAAFTTLNYNDYFASGTQAVLAYFGGADVTTLAALRTATTQDANSVSADPQYVSATDLHAVASALNNAATPIASVTLDIDGETRSATTPDIGADEFTPAPIDVAATALLNPLTVGCYGASETVAVSITNNTGTALNFALNPTTVTVTVTKPDNSTQTFTTTLNTGTLAANTAQTVTLPGTLNLTNAGTYSFAVTTTTTGDGTPGNDNLTVTRTVVGVAAQPQLVTFTGFTGANLSTVFPGWSEAAGATVPTGTTSLWTNQTGFGSTGNTTAKVNLYGAATARNEWILSPKFLATSSTVLTFDAGLSDFGSTSADPAGMTGTDDFVEVRISTDCGQTFTRIPTFAQFNAANQPTNGSLRNYSVDLSAYSGQQIILGFFASTGTTQDTPDYDFHLDNISVRSPLPIDLGPLALVTPTATQGCYTAAETVSVSVTNLGSQTLDFAANPATVTAVVTTPSGPQTLTGSITTGTLGAGANQTVTLAPTLDMSAAGTYSFAITATVAGDQTTSNDALAAVTRTVAAPVAGTLAPASSTICVSGTASLTLTGAANGTIQYQSSTDNVTFTDVAGATSAAFTTPVLTSTTYYRAQVRCGTAVATSNVSTLTVNNPLVASTNTPLSICSGSTATLSATASAGYSIRFFSTATGGTALTSTTAGSYTTPALTASTTYYAEAFTGSSASVGPLTNAIGTGSTSTVSNYLQFNVSQPTTLLGVNVYPGAAGNVVIDYRSSTGTLIQTATVAVTAAQVNTKTFIPLNFSLVAGTAQRLVIGTGSVSLYRNDSGASYPYTGGGVTITGNSFDAAYYYYYYDWSVSSECASAARTAIQVNVTQPATASFTTASGTTCGTSAYQLAGTVGGSATGGTYTSSGTGTFSPDANTLTATYTPSAADVAAGTVTITLTSAGSTPCPAATASFALSISPAPVATFSYPAATTYCAGSASTVTPTLGSSATAGTFSSTTGLTIDPATGVITLSSSTAGTYTVTNTVAASGACAAVSATATATITPATTATFSYGGGTFCVTGTNPTATVTGTAGGTFSSTSGLTINATTGAITLSSSTPGTYTVTYTVAGPCGSSSTQLVTITTAPVATFSYGTSPSYCVSGATNPAPSFGTGASGGVFSSTAGLTIDPATGTITLASSTPGTYTVTNTIAANGGCAAATATAQVTITAAPLATFSYGTTSTFCVSGTTAPAVVLGTGATAGTFSSTAGLTLNATTGAITLSSSTPGTYTVTNTLAAANGCAAATATAQVTITAAPLATFSYGTTSTFCVTGATSPTVVLGTGSTAGTFSSTAGLTINASTGAITLSSSTPGTYTVTNTVAAANGCAAATATAQVTITAAPLATFSYASASACAGSAALLTPTLGTGATAGTFSSAAGLTINATTGVVDPATSTAGTYTVTNTVAASGGCAAATGTTTVTINALPATPTYTYTYPTRSTVLFTSSVAPAGTTYQWYLNGGIIAGATSQTYTANGAVAPGNYTVRFISTATGCQSAPSTVLVVTATNQALAGSSLRLFPNPTPSGQVTLELTGYRSATQLTVLDALGRVVTQQLLPANAGTATHALDLTGAATGVYLLRLSNADGVETHRLVRE